MSLVELLVAIAVLGVLSSVTAVSVATFRESTMKSKSTSNLRQLATANLTYASEHGTFCPSQSADNNTRWHGWRPNAGVAFDPSKGYLAPYLGRDGRIGQCPKMEEILEEHGSGNSFELGTGGYGYNDAYIGGTPAFTKFTDRNVGIAHTIPERMVNVVEPAKTVMFTTTAFQRGQNVQEYAYCHPYQFCTGGMYYGTPLPSVHFRFDGKALVAWCDGHVSEEAPDRTAGGDKEYQLIGWFGPEEENGYWNSRRYVMDSPY